MIRNHKHVPKATLYLADSTLCNLVRQYEENTIYADLIESATNRRRPLWLTLL